MDKLLFEYLDRKGDHLWIAKEFFNSINTLFFIEALGYLVEGTGYGSEYSCCEFPDELDYDYQFDGVRFIYQDDELVVSEEVFRSCLRLACKQFVDAYPDKRIDVDKLLTSL